MKRRNVKKPPASRKSVANPLRSDPTRTSGLRRQFQQVLDSQFASLDAAVVKWLRGLLSDLSEKKIIEVDNSNQNHDELGRFASKDGSESFSPHVAESVVKDYVGIAPKHSGLSVLEPKEFDAKFGSPDDEVHGGVAAIRTPDGKIFLKKGYEGDAVHELVHAAGTLPHGVSDYLNEGVTQSAAEKIGAKSGLPVRKTYNSEVKDVEKYVIPSTGLSPQEFLHGYAKAEDKGKFVTDAIWKAHGDKFSDVSDWGSSPKSAIEKNIREFIGPGPHLTYLVDELGVGKGTHNSFCPTGEGGGVDPTCSSTSSEVKDVEDKWTSDWIKGLSRDEKEAINDYTLDSDTVNSALRNGFMNRHVEALTNDVDSALSESKTLHDMQLFRGMQHDPGWSVGDKHEEEGYTSASRNKHTATDFADSHDRGDDKGVLVEVHLPKGSTAASIAKLSKSYASEGEILCARGSTFEVTSRKRVDGRTIYYGTLHTPDITDNSSLSSSFQEEYEPGGRFCLPPYDPHLSDGGWVRYKLTANDASSPESDTLKGFKDFLDSQTQQKLTGKQQKALWRKFVTTAHAKGMERAYDDATAAQGAFDASLPDGQARTLARMGAKGQFLSTLSKSQDTTEEVTESAFKDLKTALRESGQAASQALLSGLRSGEDPSLTSAKVQKELHKGQRRVHAVMQVHASKAYAEGQLDALEALGTKRVGAKVEWTTADDPQVCPRCEGLEGKVYRIKDARGLLPLHVSCRCSWGHVSNQTTRNAFEEMGHPCPIPNMEMVNNMGHRRFNQQRQAENVQFEELRDIPDPWYTENAFCPTGEGGGVDPSCSKSDSLGKGITELRRKSQSEASKPGANPALGDESRPELTDAEKNACRRYTAIYETLNKNLREGKPVTKEDAETDKALTSAFAKCKPFNEPVWVNRGLSLHGPDLEKFLNGCRESEGSGNVVKMPAYTSTTTWLARDNGQPAFGGNVSLEIKAKYGLDIKPHATPSNRFESELLLDKQSEFKVTKVEKTENGWRVHMEQVNNPKEPTKEPESGPATTTKGRGWWSKLTGNTLSSSRFVGSSLNEFVFHANYDPWYDQFAEPVANSVPVQREGGATLMDLLDGVE